MENLKLVSVRLIPENLREIDKLVKSHDYWTRSLVINNLLNACLKCCNPGTLFKMVSTYYPDDKGYTIDFKIDREKLHREKEYEPISR